MRAGELQVEDNLWQQKYGNLYPSPVLKVVREVRKDRRAIYWYGRQPYKREGINTEKWKSKLDSPCDHAHMMNGEAGPDWAVT